MGNPRPKPKHLAAKLLIIRKNLGLSQIQLADRLNLLNLNQLYHRISEYETGRREPCLRVLLGYARVAGIHIDDLVDDEIKPESLRQ